MKPKNSYIHSISYYLPENRLTNKELSSFFNQWTEEKIFEKTGIMERRIANHDEYVSDLAEKAALKHFNEHNINPREIDFIILCTQSPDYYLPTTACVLQEKLGIPTHCGAFDINLGCSGFVYALALAKSIINDGMAKNVLLLMSEIYTKHINHYDKSTRAIFGDGAASILVTDTSAESSIGKFVFGTDGKGANNLIIPAGGMKNPRSDKTSINIKDKYGNIRSMENLYMNGPKIFEFALNVVPLLVEDVLKKNELEFDQIDLFVFHQASIYLLESLREKMSIPNKKFYTNIAYVGNTVSASIPIALKDAEMGGQLKRTDTVMLIGFGVGYSWAGTVLKY